MKLARYRSQRRPSFPVWLTGLLGLLWLGWIGWGFVEEQDLSAYDAEGIYLTYVDKQLRLLSAGQGKSELVLWLTGAHEEEETLRELREMMERLREQTDLWVLGSTCLAYLHAETGQKQEALEVLEACVEGSRTPSFRILENYLRGEELDQTDVDLLRGEVSTGACYSWDVRIYRLCVPLQEGEEAWLFEASRSYDEVALRRALVGFGIWVLLVVAALVLLGPAILILRRGRFRGYLRVFAVWSPATLLGLFFAVHLLSDAGALVAYGAFSLSGQLLPDQFYHLIDLVFRLFPAVALALLLFRPDHAWRVFFPHKSVVLPVVVVALGAIGLLNWALFTAAESVAEIDPTDFLWWTDPTALELTYLYLAGVIMAPISEELLCRGVLFLGLRKRLGSWPALLISSVIFALLHTQYDLFGVISVGIFGAIAAGLAWRTNSLLPGIVLHALLNLILMGLTHYEFYLPL